MHERISDIVKHTHEWLERHGLIVKHESAMILLEEIAIAFLSFKIVDDYLIITTSKKDDMSQIAEEHEKIKINELKDDVFIRILRDNILSLQSELRFDLDTVKKYFVITYYDNLSLEDYQNECYNHINGEDNQLDPVRYVSYELFKNNLLALMNFRDKVLSTKNDIKIKL